MATRITDLPADARPREKLLTRGAQALTDAELVALLLRTGVRGASAIELGADLIARFGGLHGLLHADAAQLHAIKGLGPAKYAELVAVLELARRALVEPMAGRAMLDNPQAVGDYLRLWLGGLEVEVFAALFLDARHQLIRALELSRGTLAHTSVYPREVVKLALAHNASALVVAHNHPSGLAEPSPVDRLMTDRLKSALDLVDVRMLDHFVVTRERVFSFTQAGLL